MDEVAARAWGGGRAAAGLRASAATSAAAARRRSGAGASTALLLVAARRVLVMVLRLLTVGARLGLAIMRANAEGADEVSGIMARAWTLSLFNSASAAGFVTRTRDGVFG